VEKYRMECNCRKPKTGLYEQACRDFDIDMSSSIAIGDKIRDCAVCSVYGCRGFLISDSEAPEIIEAVRNGKYPEIKYAENLLQCAEEIKL
jgi:D-glycero-D-manno-heptose 1,7-bisphosphate phosphatase